MNYLQRVRNLAALKRQEFVETAIHNVYLSRVDELIEFDREGKRELRKEYRDAKRQLKDDYRRSIDSSDPSSELILGGGAAGAAAGHFLAPKITQKDGVTQAIGGIQADRGQAIGGVAVKKKGIKVSDRAYGYGHRRIGALGGMLIGAGAAKFHEGTRSNIKAGNEYASAKRDLRKQYRSRRKELSALDRLIEFSELIEFDKSGPGPDDSPYSYSTAQRRLLDASLDHEDRMRAIKAADLPPRERRRAKKESRVRRKAERDREEADISNKSSRTAGALGGLGTGVGLGAGGALLYKKLKHGKFSRGLGDVAHIAESGLLAGVPGVVAGSAMGERHAKRNPSDRKRLRKYYDVDGRVKEGMDKYDAKIAEKDRKRDEREAEYERKRKEHLDAANEKLKMELEKAKGMHLNADLITIDFGHSPFQAAQMVRKHKLGSPTWGQPQGIRANVVRGIQNVVGADNALAASAGQQARKLGAGAMQKARQWGSTAGQAIRKEARAMVPSWKEIKRDGRIMKQSMRYGPATAPKGFWFEDRIPVTEFSKPQGILKQILDSKRPIPNPKPRQRPENHVLNTADAMSVPEEARKYLRVQAAEGKLTPYPGKAYRYVGHEDWVPESPAIMDLQDKLPSKEEVARMQKIVDDRKARAHAALRGTKIPS